jgi:hypothetical protein
MYLLGVLFFYEAFTPNDGEERGYFYTSLVWPYIAIKLIIMRIIHGKQEED